jgi:ankyrin repeat protein
MTVQTSPPAAIRALLARKPIKSYKQLQQKDLHGMTPLLLAASHGRCRTAALMVRHEMAYSPAPAKSSAAKAGTNSKEGMAPPDPAPTSLSRDMKSGLQLLCEAGHASAAAWMIGFRLTAGSLRGPLENILPKDSSGTTILHAACASNNILMVRWLLTLGMSAAAKQNDGSTAFHFLAAVGPSAKVELLDALLAMSPSTAGVANSTQNNAVHVAAFHGSAALIAKLAQHCKLNKQNAAGYTPVVLAIQMAHAEAVQALLDAGADVNVTPTEKCAPPLLFAVQMNQDNIVNMLLKSGADPNKIAEGQQSALYRAASLNNEAMVQALLSKGADVNGTDNENSTALHIAANNNCLKVVTLLLEHNANPSERTSSGYSPIHYAAGHGNLEMTVALVEAGASFRERGGKGSVDVVTALAQSKKCKASSSVILGRLNTVETLRNRRRNNAAAAETEADDMSKQDNAVLGEIADRHAEELLQLVQSDEQRQVEKREKERAKRKSRKQKAKLDKVRGSGDLATDALTKATVDACSSKAPSVVETVEQDQEEDIELVENGGDSEGEADTTEAMDLPEVDFDAWPHLDVPAAAAAAAAAAPRMATTPVPAARVAAAHAVGARARIESPRPAAPVLVTVSPAVSQGFKKKKAKKKDRDAVPAVPPPPTLDQQLAAAMRNAQQSKYSGEAKRRAEPPPLPVPEPARCPAAAASGAWPHQSALFVLDGKSFPELGAPLPPPKSRRPAFSNKTNPEHRAPPGLSLTRGKNHCSEWSDEPFDSPIGLAHASSYSASIRSECEALLEHQHRMQEAAFADSLHNARQTNDAGTLPPPVIPEPSAHHLDLNRLQGLFSETPEPTQHTPRHPKLPPVNEMRQLCSPVLSPVPQQGSVSSTGTSSLFAPGFFPVLPSSEPGAPQPMQPLSISGGLPVHRHTEPQWSQTNSSTVLRRPVNEPSSAHITSALQWDIWGNGAHSVCAFAPLPGTWGTSATMHNVHSWELTRAQLAYAEARGWICPLTQDLMRDPVYAKSWKTYERQALAAQQKLGHLHEEYSEVNRMLRREIESQLRAWGLF